MTAPDDAAESAGQAPATATSEAPADVLARAASLGAINAGPAPTPDRGGHPSAPAANIGAATAVHASAEGVSAGSAQTNRRTE